MQLRVMVIAALAVACADSGQKDLSSEFAEMPFRYLRGVELGMTGKRLQALRPDAKYAPYLGLQERISGFVVSYQFPSSMLESKAADVGPDDQLEGVFISQAFDSMEEAQSTWRERLLAVSSTHRSPTICESFPTGGMQARWIGDKRVLAIGAFPTEPMAPTVTDRIVYAVAAPEGMKQPKGATKIACPNS